jgi:hypothetical protein
MTSDDRMTGDLIIDVLRVLERHGYHGRDTEHTGQAICMIDDLTRVYDGTCDGPYARHPGPVPSSPHPEPQRPVPQAGQDTVILSHADVGTILAALDQAADCKRDRAEICADCSDQSCPTCQPRIQQAQAYDRIAAQLLRTARQARAAYASQPEQGSPRIPAGQAEPAVGKEAGQ